MEEEYICKRIEIWDGVYTVDRTETRIVRCKDCKHYYEVENYHPNGNYVSRCCKYFDTYNDEVESDGFCAWGEPKQAEIEVSE